MPDPWFHWITHQRHGGDPDYGLTLRAAIGQIYDQVLDSAPPQAGMTIVDIGTGDGMLAFAAFARTDNHLNAILTDTSAELLEHVQREAAIRGIAGQCDLRLCAAERLDVLPAECADRVYLRAVLAYLKDKAAVARHCLRLLKPGGRFALGEPILRDKALRCVAMTRHLRDRRGEVSDGLTTLHRTWMASHLPSTIEELMREPLTNFSERDLLIIFQEAGFTDLHLELHVDIKPMPVMKWTTFLAICPRPGVPNLSEVMNTHFTASQCALFEQAMRPLVETGQLMENLAVAYLSGTRPA